MIGPHASTGTMLWCHSGPRDPGMTLRLELTGNPPLPSASSASCFPSALQVSLGTSLQETLPPPSPPPPLPPPPTLLPPSLFLPSLPPSILSSPLPFPASVGLSTTRLPNTHHVIRSNLPPQWIRNGTMKQSWGESAWEPHQSCLPLFCLRLYT